MDKALYDGLRKIITVEPLLICWLIPSFLLHAGIENLKWEKGCLVNLGLNDQICSNLMNKTINKLDCSQVFDDYVDRDLNVDQLFYPTKTKILVYVNVWEEDEASTNNATAVVSGNNRDVLQQDVCQAENNILKIMSKVENYNSWITQAVQVFIVVLAGAWSDKKGLRKPCMMFPLIGEFLGCTCLFLSAVFMRQVPLEVGAILDRLMPAMLGGDLLMLIGIYSYMSDITSHDSRTLRFAFLPIFSTKLLNKSLVYSKGLYQSIGYLRLFLMCMGIYAAGIAYCLFILEEVDPKQAEELDTLHPKEKPAETNENGIQLEEIKREDDDEDKNEHAEINEDDIMALKVNENNPNHVVEIIPEKQPEPPFDIKIFLHEFFDKNVPQEYIKIYKERRDNFGKHFIIGLTLAYFLFLSPIFGEFSNLYKFTKENLEWKSTHFNEYLSYNMFSNILFGTTILTGTLSKIFQMTDPMIGLISTACSIVARPMFAFANTSPTFYAASALDLFSGSRAIVTKSFISKLVRRDEVGKVFAFFGVLFVISSLIMSPLYRGIYAVTAASLPGLYYMFSEIFLIPTVLIFIFIVKKMYLYMKQQETEKQAADPDPKQFISNMDTIRMLCCKYVMDQVDKLESVEKYDIHIK